MFSYYTTLKNIVCVATLESSRGRRRTPRRQTMIFERKQLKSRECGTFRRISWVMEHDKRVWGWFGVTFLTSSPINFLQVAHSFSKTNSAHQILSCKTVTQIVKKYFSRFLITFSAPHIRPYHSRLIHFNNILQYATRFYKWYLPQLSWLSILYIP